MRGSREGNGKGKEREEVEKQTSSQEGEEWAGNGVQCTPRYERQKRKRHMGRKRKAAYKIKSVANFSTIGISSCQV